LKNNAAQKKYAEASDSENQAASVSDLGEKQIQLDNAARYKKEGDNLSQQAVVAYNLAKDMETEADAKQLEANQSEQYANDLEIAVKSNSPEALDKLEKESKELEKNQTTTKTYTPDNLTKQAQEKNAEAARLEERKNELKAEMQESMFDEKIAREEILKAKNDSVKESNEVQLKNVLAVRKDKEAELGGIDSKISKLKEDAVNLEDEARINKEILSEIASASNTNLTEIAQEDKQKLDAQFSAQRSNSNTSASAKTEIPANQTKTTSVNKENNTKAVATNNNNSKTIEDYTAYVNSFDESKKEQLLLQSQRAQESADSIAKVLNNATEPNEIKELTESQNKLQEIANSKKLASNTIAYNIYNKEYDANRNALNQKLQGLPENDKANFSNSLSQIESDYQKAVTYKESAFSKSNLKEKDTELNTAVNAQNVVLVRQRKLLEQANSSIANASVENKATAEFKGFNTDRNSSATEAVNSLRPDYSNYKSNLQVPVEEVAVIKRSTEFLQFEGIINQAKTFEDNADKKAKEYTSVKTQGEEKVIESQQIIDLAAEEKKRSKKQALAEEAIRVDNEGRDLLIKADTIKVQAQNEMLKAAAVKAEADKFMAKLDKTQQDKILAVYQNQVLVPASEAASNETENKKEEIAANNENKTISGIEKSNESGSQNTVSANKEASNSTEQIKSVENNQQVESKSNAAPTAKVKDKESVLKEIKATPDYIGYAAIKNEAETLKVTAALKRVEADSVKVQAQRDAINSNDLFEFAAARPKKKDRKEAQLKAEEMDRVSKENELKADSLNKLAEAAETSARMKQYEADNYLRKFDETKSKTLLMAYNNTVPEELLKVEQPVSQPEQVVTSNTKATVKNTEANKQAPVETKQIEVAANNNEKTQNNSNNKSGVSENKTQSNLTAKNNELAKSDTQQKSNTELAKEDNVTQNQPLAPVVEVKKAKPDVKTTVEYNKFVSLKQEADNAAAAATTWKQRVDSTRALSQQKLDESNNKLEEAASLKKRKRKPLVKEAAELDYASQLLVREADSLTVFSNEANKNAKDKKSAADTYLSSIDKDLSLRIMRSIEGIPEPIEVEEVQTVEANNQNSTNSATLKTDAVVSVGIQKGKSHSTSNPIKMNEPLPNGLVFKVQIGAFNKPVADNAFGTVSPVSGEAIANSNLIRYTAGLFTAFEDAVNARKELNSLNYKDAFVVAYCYGKRMSVTEAKALLNAGKDCKSGGQIPANQNAIANNISNKTSNENASNLNSASGNNPSLNNNVNTNTSNANLNAPAQIKSGETLPQQDIQTIKGLLYTVQVGVYSKPVKAGQLYNITPLYYELNQKGQYRYTSGIFNDVREAAKAKDLIVQIGVSDAFVSAYINGKRIPMEQAAAMEAQQGKAVFAQIQGMNVQPKTIPVEGTIQQRTTVAQETKVVTPVAPNNTPVNIVYKVQLGAFKNEVPVEIINKYLTIADKGIANFKSGDLTIYTVGNFKDAASAEAIKSEVIAKGIADAFVIALNNGEKITLEDAKKLGGK
jgi:hypothetical protein